MAVSEDDVRRLAHLARIALTEAEVRETALRLGSLLDYIGQIAAVDVSGVDAEVGVSATPLRPDVARPGLPRHVVLAQAPSSDAGLFEVPRMLAPKEDA